MYSMYEFRDEYENIVAMCENFAVFHLIKDYFISQGYSVIYSNHRYYVLENDN